MEVNQAKYMNFFTNINNNNNNTIPLPEPKPDPFQPMYNLNDVVYHHNNLQGKMLPQAVKADSGITFNNNLIPPQPSRKRAREPVSCVSRNNTSSSINVVVDKGSNCDGFSFLGEDLSFQIMQQQLELDRLISLHMEKMKMEIEGRKKQQLMRIMGTMEESLSKKLREKNEELSKMGRINFALEEKVKSLHLENQIWRDLAQSNEATANALRTNLEHVLQQMNDNAERATVAAAEVADDATSCCGSSGSGQEYIDKNNGNSQNGWIYRGKSGVNSNGNNNNNNNKNERLCRKCGEGESSVLVLPCRHLCLCTSCGPVVNSCPICHTVKNASVHVNLA